MAEANINAEMARHLDEHGGRRSRRHERAIEIAEAVLAVVAVLTAWSGYQASLWDAESARATPRPRGSASRPSSCTCAAARSSPTTPARSTRGCRRRQG